MGVVENFIGEYEREIDYWDATARTVRGLLETELSSSGLRAIVTSRAKSVDRLREKVRGRNRSKRYRSVSQIRRDIADLAGVRVAMYFPGQMDEAERVINAALTVHEVKRFPAPSGSTVPGADHGGPGRRFSGYGARHFRVSIPESRLSAGQERYASAVVEVQVASVLMHAWSEVEHDLVYKPLEGELSAAEHALLDQLNGLVLAGEIALEQLQRAGDVRVAAAKTPLRNHYELAEFLRTHLSALGEDLTDTTLGRVDVLFEFLAEENEATAASVETYLDRLELDFERRPVAEQLADLMLSGDEARYKAYLRAMAASRHTANRPSRLATGIDDDSARTLAVGEFIAAWVLLETQLRRLGLSAQAKFAPLAMQLRLLVERELITAEEFGELSKKRRLRNEVLHGGAEEVLPERLHEAAVWLRNLSETIDRNATQD
ncbi:GTP pyrophosphokinase [Microbacterium wangchenii]|uniref:GTP pyrophosphokinase n=1 Tax=Microbacterium wangchenii TaxID=2541726 RepID=UPI0016507DA7|nr:RelA/SpoT domain-containing protein [Microbacterium wangchenii]